MKNTCKALKLSSAVLLIILSFISCDKDFNTIESDVLGKGNSNFITDNENISITAFNKKLRSLKINNLSSNLFGFFNDPAFGQTTASIVTQITPTSFNTDFGNNTEIDSVVLRIPYFSKIDAGNSPDTNGNQVYTIDSLYGSAHVKLSIYQNKYFLRDFNPNSNIDESQNYYSMSDIALTGTDNIAVTENSIINFDLQKGDLIHEILKFLPSNKTIVLKSGSGDNGAIERLKPALRVKLDTAFWKTTIIDKQGDPVLSNANNFNEYFRGLYFKAQAIEGDGNMVLFNFASSDANIIIYYSKDSTVSGEKTQSTYTLNFTGNRLNPFINDYSLVTLTDGDKNLGDEKLYLKGAAGSMAVIDLFSDEDLDGNGKPDSLDDLISEYVDDGNPIKLINQAQLIIYEDTPPSLSSSNNYHKYDRLYAYDIKNNSPLIDYRFDLSKNTANPFNSKIGHLGQRKDKDDDGIFKYKIRITEHLNNLIFRDSTNTKIGLILSNNVNYTTNAQILNSTDDVTNIPAASLLTPRGTILHGSNENVPAQKRMRLDIFFTHPE